MEMQEEITLNIICEEFLNSIYPLTLKFDYEKYKQYIAEFTNKITQLNKNENLNLSIFPQISHIINYLFNFENIFLLSTNLSREVTFSFILTLLLLQNNVSSHSYSDSFLKFSILNKLVILSSSNIEVEYIKNLEDIIKHELNKYINYQEQDLETKITNSHLIVKQLLLNMIQNLHYLNNSKLDKSKNIKEEFKEIDESLALEEIPHLQNANLSISQSFKLDILTLEDFKSKVKSSLKNEDDKILKIFNDLKHESKLIEEEKGPSFSQMSTLNIKCLYIFCKILDSLDEVTDENIKKAFYNLIIRTKHFTQYLLQEVTIKTNFLRFNNPEGVYVHRYLGIANFFIKNLLNDIDQEKVKMFRKLTEKILDNLKFQISKALEKIREEREFRSMFYSYEESKLNYELSSLMSCSKLGFEYTDLLLNLNIFNLNPEKLNTVKKSISSLLGRISQVNRLEFLKNNTYILNLSLEMYKFPVTARIMLTINKNEVFRLNNLLPLLKYDPLVYSLFIFFKFWAIQRRLFITVDEMLNKSNEKIFLFDNCLLIILVLFYFISIKHIPSINQLRDYSNKGVSKFILQKEFREDKKEFQTDIYVKEVNYFSHHLNIPKYFSRVESKTMFLGKHFINFFYFVINVIEKHRMNMDYSIIMGLGMDSISIEDLEERGIILIDHFPKTVSDKNIPHHDVYNYCNNYIAEVNVTLSREEYQKLLKIDNFDILNVWDNRHIKKLEKEACRALHYCLCQDEEDFIKLLFKKT